MMQFPTLEDESDLPVRRMTLAEYARFSAWCLEANAAVTPENCMDIRQDETEMPRPFRLIRQAGESMRQQ